MSPRRIQRKRTKGWRMPANTKYVGRPSKWGNPWKAGVPHPPDGDLSDNEDCARWYRERLDAMRPRELAWWLLPLRGKNLACWCSLDKPCHADILLKLANA